MPFNSPAYILLLGLTILGLKFIKKPNNILILLSLLFLGFAGLKDTFIFLFTISINWLLIKFVEEKKLRLWLAIPFNVILLAFFKYKNIFFNYGSFNLPLVSDYLPLGISFYCFQSIAYQVDLYKNLTKGAKNFKEFILFKSFFPQLIAGPIVRANDLIPQLRNDNKNRKKYRLICFGLLLCSLGLTKKIVFADSISTLIDQYFVSLPKTTMQAWLAAIMYSFQVYFDFSGYSDIAIGSAYLLNIRLPLNFKAPYLSSTPSEFWRRWHISLSTWIRDYLYIPLGGSSGSYVRSNFIVILTMAIAGLWHGMNLNFLIWGIFWGIYICIGRFFKFKNIKPFYKWPLHFIIIVMLWVLFRSPNLYYSFSYWSIMLGVNNKHIVDLNASLSNSLENPNLTNLFIFVILLFFIFHFLEAKLNGRFLLKIIKKLNNLFFNSILITLNILLVLIPVINTNPFIYFRF
tara:strand:- start:406 stop:1785 length:1380 start_codon:yes stop_codon:yes gene_type:complete